MKLILGILISLYLPASFSKDDRLLLKCLGREESQLHKKKLTGPIYDLNQRLIAEMIQIPKADISQKHLNDICYSSEESPSLRLLEISITDGKNLLVIPKDVPAMQKEVAQGMIDDYLEATNEIFLKFISQIQAQAPTPHCLQEEIPMLKSFFIDYKYLEEEIDVKRIFKGRDKKILKYLKDYPQAFERCRERLKKKPKSGSTAPDKKS